MKTALKVGGRAHGELRLRGTGFRDCLDRDTQGTLKEQPSFYNTLTTNCTTNVLMHTRVNPGKQHYSWKILLSGYTPLYTYEFGRLDTSLPFEELRRRGHINEAAHAANDAPDFSQRIRANVPVPKDRSRPAGLP